MYSEKVMDHFTNPRNVGEIPDANAVGQVGNPQCGDIMKIYMDIEISADEKLTLKESHDIAENVHDLLEETYPKIKHIMVHVNPYEYQTDNSSSN